MRVGIVDYLNSWPLAWGFLTGRMPSGWEASYHPPARVAELLAAGELDVGLVPSIEVQRIPGLEVVPGLGVCATHEVRSVILVSKSEPSAIRRLALDENSRTSAALVRILLADVWGCRPETVTASPDLDAMLETADAALVIGDPALHVATHPATAERGYRVVDLAAAWRGLTGHPFVFAVWAVRRDAASAAALAEPFRRSLALGLGELDAVVGRAVDRLGLDEATVREYLTANLSYPLGPDEAAGLVEYWRRAAAHGFLATPRSIPLSA